MVIVMVIAVLMLGMVVLLQALRSLVSDLKSNTVLEVRRTLRTNNLGGKTAGQTLSIEVHEVRFVLVGCAQACLLSS